MKPNRKKQPMIAPSPRLEALRSRMVSFFGRLPPEASDYERKHLATIDLDAADHSELGQYASAFDFYRNAPDQNMRSVWEKIGGRFGRIERRHAHAFALDALIQHIAFSPGSKVVSLGSGTGVIETFLAKEVVPKGTITCLDFAHSMNLNARSLAIREGVPNMRFVEGKMDHLPFADRSQDVVLAINSIQWIKDWQKAISEMRRVLKPNKNARLVISVNSNPNSHMRANWGENELAMELKRQGFQPLRRMVFWGPGQNEKPHYRTIFFAAPPLQGTKRK